MPTATTLSFGTLLKQLRKQAGMTQRDLAAALHYSDSLISSLEKEQRLPDLAFVVERLIPALGLQDDPKTAAWLVEHAAAARGEQPPASFTLHHTTQLVLHEEWGEQGLVLPAPPTALIGREAEVTQLCHRLLGHQGRLLTLLGPPGIGKTRLALAVAERLQPHYRDGVVFVPLAAVNEAASMAATVADAVGAGDSPKPPKVRLVEALRRKTTLLVLDNLEQMRNAAPLIAELLAECPGVAILATSRERLHLRAEQRYKVPPLALAAAVALFTQRAQAVNADFHRTPANQPTLEAICEELDRLPLAIELCAWQLELFSPAQLLAQLRQRGRLAVLVDGAHDLPPQHRTLRHAIERSYRLLDEVERRLLRSLGVFVGGFALAELTAVMESNIEAGDWRLHDGALAQPLLANLQSLIGKSLVRAETTATGEQRFLLLETIREFALEQLQAHGEEAQLRQRHYATYLQLFRTGDSHLRGAAVASWAARLETEQDNLRAALQWKLDNACYVDAAWLLIAANYFWHLRGQRYEQSQWLLQLLPYRQQLPTDLRFVILNQFYGAALGLEAFPSVDHYQAEIRQLLADCTDPCLRSTAWYFLLFPVDHPHTLRAMEESVAWARAAYVAPGLSAEFGAAADRDYMLGANLWGYGKLLIDRGELARAEPIAMEGLQLFRRLENPIGIGDALANLGRLALLRGDIVQAHSLYREAVAIAMTVRNHSMQCAAQLTFGIITLYVGDAPEAQRLLHESLRLALALQDKFFLARSYSYLAETALWAGNLHQAEQWLAQSLAYHGGGDPLTTYEVVRLFFVARLATAQQQYRRAALLFGLAEQAHSQIHYAIGGPIHTLAVTALATVQAALEPAVFAEAFAAGQQLSLEEAFETVLAAEPTVTAACL